MSRARRRPPRFALIFQRPGNPTASFEERQFASESEAREWARQEGVTPVRLEHLVPIARPGGRLTFMRSRYPY